MPAIPKKRSRDAIRQTTITEIAKLVPAKSDYWFKLYKDKFLLPAESFWRGLYPSIGFPLVQDPTDATNPAMKGFILFCLIHTYIQLRKNKDTMNYHPFYTLTNSKGVKAKKFDNVGYFSKFIVFYIVNGGMPGTSGWDNSFLDLSETLEE
jgi:hypothetical protein